MTRQYRVFDSDTHVGPTMEVLEDYLSSDTLTSLEAFSKWRKIDDKGYDTYTMGGRSYKRRLGTTGRGEEAPYAPTSEEIEQGKVVSRIGYRGRREVEVQLKTDLDPAKRIKDMDLEGVEVNVMIPSGWYGAFTTIDNVVLEQAMYAAYNRWMADYCSAFPSRLTGLLLLSGRDVKGSLEQIELHGTERWPMGVFLLSPDTMPLDHPDLEPLWAAAAHWNMSIALHTFASHAPYAPGGLDTWDNTFIQRACAHPWSGMRSMAALLGSGTLDRNPDLRIGVLEAGHGWLPSFLKRLDEHTKSASVGLSAPLKMLPSEYAQSGRFFQSLEISEGKEITHSVIDLLGDDVLMYASDYPHDVAWFPNSVKTVEDWNFHPETAKKLFWENALRYYAIFGVAEFSLNLSGAESGIRFRRASWRSSQVLR